MTSVPAAVHPEAVPGDPSTMRWVVPAGLLPPGALLRAPGALGALLADSTLTDGLVEHAAVWLTLPDGSWFEQGAYVRSALQSALGDPAGWIVDETAHDAALARIVAGVLAGSVGDYVRSHGGALQVADVTDGVVRIALDGTCDHCPAAGLTLHARVETAVRERWPALAGVRQEGSDLDARSALSRWLRRS